MSLRARTLSSISLALILLIAVLYVVSLNIVRGGFRKVETDLVGGFTRIEQQDADRNVRRVKDALTARIENLAIKAADWAQWDDTYKFVQDHNRAYSESNLTQEALSALKINLILILDASGKVVFGTAFDLEAGEKKPLPEGLLKYLSPSSLLLSHLTPESLVSGILLLPDNPLMIVSRPIVTSDGKGPMRGAFLFGRFLDDEEFAQLSRVTHLALQRHRADEALPPDFSSAQAALTGPDRILIRPLSAQTIAGYTAFKDLFGEPSLLLRVDIPREIYRQGAATQREIRHRGDVVLLSLVASILACGVVLAAVLLWVLESSVLSRVAGLSAKTAEIGASGDFSGRVPSEGADEISTLAGSVNAMLGALGAAHGVIEARNAEMRLLMDTIPTGLLSLDEEFRVNPEHSRSVAKILGTADLGGRAFLEVLGLTGDRAGGGRLLWEFLDCLRQELVDEEIVAGLNPFEELSFGVDASARWLRLRYSLIHRGEGRPSHILATIEDITKVKQLAAQVAQGQRENLQLKAIAEDPDLFREFLSETKRILGDVHDKASDLDATDASRPLVTEIFRGVHTIKGVAGSFGLANLADLASRLESSLEPLRREGEISASNIEETRQSLAALSAAFEEVIEGAKKILGDDVGSGSGTFLRIPSEELKRHIHDIRAMPVDEALKDVMVARIKEEMLRRLRALREVPARRGLARSLKIVPGLLERLGKPVKFTFDGQDTPLDCDVAQELNTPLIHLLRNALDHGIEPPDERVEAGKTEQGEVRLAVARQNGSVAVTLADDGRGLDPERLKASAVRKGILSAEECDGMTSEEAWGLIFRPGFSTATEVTDVSGRGVGMDAVLESIRSKLKGEIRVASVPGKGTRFTIAVPCCAGEPSA